MTSPEPGKLEKPKSLWAARCFRCCRVRSAGHPFTPKHTFVAYELRKEGWGTRMKQWTCPVCLGRCEPDEFRKGPHQKREDSI